MIVLEHRAVLAIALAEPLSDWLLGEVAKAGGVVAGPAHQPARALHVLADLERAGRIERHEGADAVAAVLTMPFQAHPPERTSVSRARQLSTLMPLLDALHVALAETLDVPLLTTGAAGWSRGAGGAGDGSEDSGPRTGPACELLVPPSWVLGTARPADGW